MRKAFLPILVFALGLCEPAFADDLIELEEERAKAVLAAFLEKDAEGLTPFVTPENLHAPSPHRVVDRLLLDHARARLACPLNTLKRRPSSDRS